MGEFAERIDAMRVRVSLGDGAITAELCDRDQLSLAFREGFYALCDDGDLERRLARLASLLWVARTREYLRIYSDITGDYSTGEDPPIDVREAEWRAERDALVATGSSVDGRITLHARGLREWQVAIRSGTAQALNERQFGAALAEAGGGLIRDQFAKLAALSLKFYGDDR